jgi:integrase
MATLRRDKRTGFWTVRIYWKGQQQQRSCCTKRRPEALRALAVVEDTLHLLKTGRLEMPVDIDPIDWIVSGGKLKAKRIKEKAKDKRFGEICDSYLEDQKQKQPTTLGGEILHIRHLKNMLTGSTSIENIDLEKLSKYRRSRSRQKHHEKFPSDATIRKELVTFRQIWVWAKQHGYVNYQCPLLDDNGRWRMAFEKPDSQQKFQTWDQITRRIERGSLSKEEARPLWRGVFLDNDQVCELLNHVQTHARHAFIYPMFAFAAYTGARRSEILRSEIEDFDFQSHQVMIRERKRRKNRRGSTRLVPLHPKLREIMETWMKNHPGGRFAIAPPQQTMLYQRKSTAVKDHVTCSQAHTHFKTTLNKSKWKVVSGFHVLRHSFGSNLVRTGKVSPDVVAKWMGHSTTEMRELYQHLFPQDGLKQISVLK